MKPTERLTKEHDEIKRMLRILERVCAELDEGRKVDGHHMTEIVDFIQNYADRYHHAKEEDLLFPAMEKAGIPREGGPIGVMLQEHDIGRGYVKEMKEAAEEYQNGDGEAASRYTGNARSFTELLRAHIDKEDSILYTMAVSHVPEEEQERLLREFDSREEEIFGPDRDRKYRDMLERLTRQYGG